MRRIAPIGLVMGVAMLTGCGTNHYYRNVGVVQQAAGPSLETHVVGGIPGGAASEVGPAGPGRLSREAVPDSVMLRDQADSGFRDSLVPQ
jgi:hypothetical protein